LLTTRSSAGSRGGGWPLAHDPRKKGARFPRRSQRIRRPSPVRHAGGRAQRSERPRRAAGRGDPFVHRRSLRLRGGRSLTIMVSRALSPERWPFAHDERGRALWRRDVREGGRWLTNCRAGTVAVCSWPGKGWLFAHGRVALCSRWPLFARFHPGAP